MCLFVIGYLFHRSQTWVVLPWTQSKILFQWKFVYLTTIGLLRIKSSNKMVSLEDGWKSLLFVLVERVTSRLNLSTDKDRSWSSLWEDITLRLGWSSDPSVFKLPTSSPFWGSRLTLPAQVGAPSILRVPGLLRSSVGELLSRANLRLWVFRCYSTEVLCEISNQITWMFQWNIFGYVYGAEYLWRSRGFPPLISRIHNIQIWLGFVNI